MWPPGRNRRPPPGIWLSPCLGFQKSTLLAHLVSANYHATKIHPAKSPLWPCKIITDSFYRLNPFSPWNIRQRSGHQCPSAELSKNLAVPCKLHASHCICSNVPSAMLHYWNGNLSSPEHAGRSKSKHPSGSGASRVPLRAHLPEA